jgi:hypothetical protein
MLLRCGRVRVVAVHGRYCVLVVVAASALMRQHCRDSSRSWCHLMARVNAAIVPDQRFEKHHVRLTQICGRADVKEVWKAGTVSENSKSEEYVSRKHSGCTAVEG